MSSCSSEKSTVTIGDIQCRWLGCSAYGSTLSLQKKYVQNILKGDSSSLVLGCEHPPTMTLGIRGDQSADLTPDKEGLDKFEIFHVRRGGQAVIHNPGQLVIYPIVNLKKLNIGVRDWLCVLSKTTRSFFEVQGVNVFDGDSEPGLFTSKQKKIAYFGIRVDRGISFHGLAININNNLEDFSLIKSCGIQNQQTTNLEIECKKKMSCSALFDLWSECFRQQTTQL